jgi:hypothetical protein
LIPKLLPLSNIKLNLDKWNIILDKNTAKSNLLNLPKNKMKKTKKVKCLNKNIIRVKRLKRKEEKPILVIKFGKGHLLSLNIL